MPNITVLSVAIIISCIILQIPGSVALKDFERCDVGKGIIKINLKNLEYNLPKKNEVFRIKWFHRQFYPYFEASYKNYIIKVDNEKDNVRIIWNNQICDFHENSKKILNILYYTELEVAMKNSGRFMFIAHGNSGFSLTCETNQQFISENVNLKMGISNANYHFHYDCPFRNNQAQGPE
ncbi:hypothetical protein ACFFRR_008550 [Megaselia abdita]